ncbi:hypothetical protein EU245_10725 [Lentibacillus lipolyticus]|nr:hypothetical protein EU245_10725 [Lentibacillus lipolyticus]
MEDMLKQILNEMQGLRTEVQDGQERLQKNVIDSLGVYTESIINHFDNQTDVLNKRVFKAETEMRNVNRQR